MGIKPIPTRASSVKARRGTEGSPAPAGLLRSVVREQVGEEIAPQRRIPPGEFQWVEAPSNVVEDLPNDLRLCAEPLPLLVRMGGFTLLYAMTHAEARWSYPLQPILLILTGGAAMTVIDNARGLGKQEGRYLPMDEISKRSSDSTTTYALPARIPEYLDNIISPPSMNGEASVSLRSDIPVVHGTNPA